MLDRSCDLAHGWLLAHGDSNRGSPESTLDASAAAGIEQLLDQMRQRLLVMHEVARWKWHHHQPITDAAREAALLKRIDLRAHELGLDAELAARFMKAQIAAGKQIQQQDMNGWQTQPPPQDEPLPGLATELRPKIDQLNVDLLDALGRLAPHLNHEQVQRRLQAPQPRLGPVQGSTTRFGRRRWNR